MRYGSVFGREAQSAFSDLLGPAYWSSSSESHWKQFSSASVLEPRITPLLCILVSLWPPNHRAHPFSLHLVLIFLQVPYCSLLVLVTCCPTGSALLTTVSLTANRRVMQLFWSCDSRKGGLSCSVLPWAVFISYLLVIGRRLNWALVFLFLFYPLTVQAHHTCTTHCVASLEGQWPISLTYNTSLSWSWISYFTWAVLIPRY